MRSRNVRPWSDIKQLLKQIFGALSSQICAELGGFEAKICVGEVKNFEENVRNALIGADSEQICEAIMFC